MTKKRRKARPVDRAALDRASLIARADAVRVLAQEIEGTDAPSKLKLNSVSHRIGEAVASGVLKFAAQRQFLFGELVRFAQDTWPEKFLGWPAFRSHVATPGAGTARLSPLRAIGAGRVLPADTVDGWRSYATRLEAECRKLADAYHEVFFECDALRQEVELLRDYRLKAEFKAAQTREKKRRAGKKGGRGRSWEK